MSERVRAREGHSVRRSSETSAVEGDGEMERERAIESDAEEEEEEDDEDGACHPTRPVNGDFVYDFETLARGLFEGEDTNRPTAGPDIAVSCCMQARTLAYAPM